MSKHLPAQLPADLCPWLRPSYQIGASRDHPKDTGLLSHVLGGSGSIHHQQKIEPFLPCQTWYLAHVEAQCNVLGYNSKPFFIQMIRGAQSLLTNYSFRSEGYTFLGLLGL